MSVYAEMLVHSLPSDDEGTPSTGELLAQLLVRRSHLAASSEAGRIAAPSALATQVAYDAALLALCRHLELPVEPEQFHHPATGRTYHEVLLATRGIRLDGLQAADPGAEHGGSPS